MMSQQLIELLDILRVRTVMYIGELSITRFGAYIRGFFHAVYLREPGLIHSKCYLHEFTKVLAKKYTIKAMLGWSDILLQVSNNNDEAALELFWKEWDEFCKLQDLEVLR